MAPEPEVIREQIEETRSSLADKLETLESEVKGTVTEAKETVEETISTVKETVQDTVSTVKRTFDLNYQVQQRPFAMTGLSFLSGLALGAFVGGRTSTSHQVAARMGRASVPPEQQPGYRDRGAAPAALWSGAGRAEPSQPGFFDKLTSQLGGEMDKVKDMAITALTGAVSEVARRSVPALASQIEQLMTNAVSRFTDQPSTGPRKDVDVSGSPTYRQPAVP